MELEELFTQCHFSKRYLGYYALKECVRITLEDENALLYLTGIYINAGKECNSSWKQVERNIRTMLNASWKCGAMKTLEYISGGKFYERPTVGNIIEILVCYLKARQP